MTSHAEPGARREWLLSWTQACPGLIVGLSSLLVIALILSLGVGAVSIPPGQVLTVLRDRLLNLPTAFPTQATIVWDFRLARGLLAIVIGAGLAVSGAAYQSLFRNPLADPFIIGAAGGASLGATIAIISDTLPVMPCAFIGALASVALVYAIAQTSKVPSAIHLLLAGVALSTLLSSSVTLLMYLSDRALHEIFGWLMGALGGRSWSHLRVTAPLVGVGIGGLWLLARPLDLLTCGEESAQSLGLDLRRARFIVVSLAALATSAAVASGGIIGFVGLLSPHMGRMLGGGSHRRLIPVSALLGGLMLLAADSLARTVMAPVELPVGILMALSGVPFFLWLLRRGHTLGIKG